MLRLFCIGLLLVPAAAHAQVYQRLDPVTGQVTYTNRPPAGVDVESEAVLRPRPSNPPARIDKSGDDRRHQARSATPATFPRIAASEQRERDLDRRAILTEELQLEVQALDRLGQKPADEKAAMRHRANIASLRKEIANLP